MLKQNCTVLNVRFLHHHHQQIDLNQSTQVDTSVVPQGFVPEKLIADDTEGVIRAGSRPAQARAQPGQQAQPAGAARQQAAAPVQAAAATASYDYGQQQQGYDQQQQAYGQEQQQDLPAEPTEEYKQVEVVYDYDGGGDAQRYARHASLFASLLLMS